MVSRNSATSATVRAIGPCTLSGENRLFGVPRETLPEVVDSPTLKEYQVQLTTLRRQLADLYRQLGAARPFSWSRMGTQRQIARVKRRIAQLERGR